MGGKYEVRFNIDDEFCPYRSEYTNSFIKFIKIIIKYKKKLIYVKVQL